ncbi:hypothetical protein [Streptomyces sp. NPDC015131]|uniref:hypothetical protein n=1 Tax=Streptomyces sp. NPDC015131 TaxID=3364941 RepID=UPI0036FE6C45
MTGEEAQYLRELLENPEPDLEYAAGILDEFFEDERWREPGDDRLEKIAGPAAYESRDVLEWAETLRDQRFSSYVPLTVEVHGVDGYAGMWQCAVGGETYFAFTGSDEQPEYAGAPWTSWDHAYAEWEASDAGDPDACPEHRAEHEVHPVDGYAGLWQCTVDGAQYYAFTGSEDRPDYAAAPWAAWEEAYGAWEAGGARPATQEELAAAAQEIADVLAGFDHGDYAQVAQAAGLSVDEVMELLADEEFDVHELADELVNQLQNA